MYFSKLLPMFTFFLTCSVGLIAHADELNHYDLKLESLGGVHYGERLDQVQNRLGKARSITNPMKDSINNCDKQVMYYDNDLEVEICSTPSRTTVYSVRVVKNDKVSTAKGARTGMSLEQIKSIYPNSVTIQEHTVLIQDNKTHMRLRFLLTNRTVYEISLFKEKKEKKTRKRDKKKWNF